MCRPSGAVKDRTPYPTVKTVGYVVTSLRDFEQNKCRPLHISRGQNLLWGKHLARAYFCPLRLLCQILPRKALNTEGAETPSFPVSSF